MMGHRGDFSEAGPASSDSGDRFPPDTHLKSGHSLKPGQPLHHLQNEATRQPHQGGLQNLAQLCS